MMRGTAKLLFIGFLFLFLFAHPALGSKIEFVDVPQSMNVTGPPYNPPSIPPGAPGGGGVVPPYMPYLTGAYFDIGITDFTCSDGNCNVNIQVKNHGMERDAAYYWWVMDSQMNKIVPESLSWRLTPNGISDHVFDVKLRQGGNYMIAAMVDYTTAKAYAYKWISYSPTEEATITTIENGATPTVPTGTTSTTTGKNNGIQFSWATIVIIGAVVLFLISVIFIASRRRY